MDRLLTFKDRLAQVRESMGMTRSQFALFLQMPANTVYKWEAGNRNPDMFNLMKICTRCDVSADWLLGLKENDK